MPGTYLPTTQLWDVSEIYSTPDIDPGMKELLVRMYQNLNLMALSINFKENGVYDTQEFVSGQQFFPSPLLSSSSSIQPTPRQTERVVVDFGALPNSAAKSVAHGIDFSSDIAGTRVYACSTKVSLPKRIIPLPSTVSGDSIELYIDKDYVVITTHSDMTAYTITYVVIETLKQL